MDLQEAREPAWIERGGWKVALLSYSKTYPIEFWASESRPGCAPGDGYLMREDIQAARAKGADLVLVAVHWGVEKSVKLRGYQVSLAQLALEAGADAVVGHHPHIWQSLEVHRGKPIAYSVGNFAFGSYSSSTTESGILYLTFDRNRRWSGGWVVPLDVNNHRVQFSPTPMKEAAAGKFFKYLAKLSKKASLSWEGTLIRWDAPDIPRTTDPEPSKPVGALPGAGK
jgi:poly-gamma-glutamate synthesis protein (capsule biosynthesis protein)